MINPKRKLFKWGPIDGKLIYPDFFNVAFTKYSKRFYGWPDTIGYYYKEKIIFITDDENLRDRGEVNFRRYILNDKKFRKYYQEWQGIEDKILNSRKKISTEYLKNLNNKELYQVFKKWTDLYFEFWGIGLLPELSNWGGEQMLERELKKKVSDQNFPFIFERLSAPENLSFYQKAELELLRLRGYTKKKKLLDKKLEDYQKNHFWILNSYHHTKILSKNYFKKQLLSYSSQKAQKVIKELNSLPQKVKREKQKLILKYNLGRQVHKIAKRLSFCIWWQDLRKFYIFLANHHIDLFLREFSRRYKVKFDDLHGYYYFELADLAENGKRISNFEIKKRYNDLVVYYSYKTNKLKYTSGLKAKKFIKPYITYSVDKKVKELKGLVVSGGKNVIGRVKILTSPKQVNKMKKGDVLATSMTSPDYILAIKKASAIITDEGGMTCHAAIVSRELKIPCIVKTEIATKILKNGDRVEVNVNKGIVKKL